jgi:hypothetical protein
MKSAVILKSDMKISLEVYIIACPAINKDYTERERDCVCVCVFVTQINRAIFIFGY